MSIEALEQFAKGGPYYGPKGGKYADPQRKIPWKEGGTQRKKRDTRVYEIGDWSKMQSPGKKDPPLKVWYVDTLAGKNGKAQEVAVTKLRGSSDYYETRTDYAELEDGRTVSSTYLFPRKPVFVKMEDDYGEFRNWVAGPTKEISKISKSMDGISALDDFTKGGGPYYGPKGGKYADPQRKIAWKDREQKGESKKDTETSTKETVSWVLGDGRRIEYTAELETEKRINADGHAVTSSKISMNETIKVDGKIAGTKIEKLPKPVKVGDKTVVGRVVNHTRGPTIGITSDIMDKINEAVSKVKKHPKWEGKEAKEERSMEQAREYEQHSKKMESTLKRSMDGISALDDFTKGGGPYYGPRGGKWQDPQHKIPWDDKAGKKKTGKKQKVAEGQLGLDFSAEPKEAKKPEKKSLDDKWFNENMGRIPTMGEFSAGFLSRLFGEAHEKIINTLQKDGLMVSTQRSDGVPTYKLTDKGRALRTKMQEKKLAGSLTAKGKKQAKDAEPSAAKEIVAKLDFLAGGDFYVEEASAVLGDSSNRKTETTLRGLVKEGFLRDVGTDLKPRYEFTNKGKAVLVAARKKRGDKEPVKEAPKEKPKEAKPKKEKAPKASKAAPTGTKDNPLTSLPENTEISDASALAFSKWKGKLALIKGPTHYDVNHPSKYNFDPETRSRMYGVRHAIDYKNQPIPAHESHLGREPRLSSRNKPYDQVSFRVGGDTSWSPGESGSFDKVKEVWVQTKVKDLSPAEKRLVQDHLEDKGYKEPRADMGAKLSASNWERALSMSYDEIQAGKNTEMANAVERFVYQLGQHGPASWENVKGIILTDKSGRLKTIIDKKKIKKSMGENDMSGIDALNDFAKGGPYIGPKGGKWADPQHKIPWDARQDKTATKEKRKEALGKRRGDKARQEETTSVQSALKMLSGWGSHGWKSLGASMQASLKSKGLVEENKKAPGTYVLNEKGKAMAAKIKKSEGIDEIMDFAKGSLPSGEPKMGSGEEQGGKLEGKGKTGGSGDSASGPAIGAPTPGKDKFSEDDEDEKKALKEHKKPLEQSTKSFRDTTPQGQRDAYALEHAQLVSRLKKGEEDERVSVSGAPRVEVEPEAMAKSRDWNQGSESRVTYSSASDEFTAELAKSEAFYHGGAPRMSPHIGIMHMKRCAVCGDRMSKALTACPHCGEGTTDLGVVYVEGE